MKKVINLRFAKRTREVCLKPVVIRGSRQIIQVYLRPDLGGCFVPAERIVHLLPNLSPVKVSLAVKMIQPFKRWMVINMDIFSKKFVVKNLLGDVIQKDFASSYSWDDEVTPLYPENL